MQRRGLLLSGMAALGLLGGSLGLHLTRTPRAGGQETPAERSFLRIHGPNDGEPLNNWVELCLEVAVEAPSTLYIYQGTRYFSKLYVEPKDGREVEVVFFPIDSTRFPNGPFSLSFYLFQGDMGDLNLLDAQQWNAWIQNPCLEESGPRLGPNVLLRLSGRPGDTEYQLRVGLDLLQLTTAPPDVAPGAAVETLAEGKFRLGLGSDDSEREPLNADGAPIEVVLNVDTLSRDHTREACLVLWSCDQKQRWAHSRPLYLSSLPQAAALIQRVQPVSHTQTTYHR